MMKKNLFNMILAFTLFILSIILLWNTGIAADEQIRVIEFVSQYNYIYWLFLFLSFVLSLSLTLQLRKK